MWHLEQALDGGKLLSLARTLHGEQSPIAELLAQLQSEVRARCPRSSRDHPLPDGSPNDSVITEDQKHHPGDIGATVNYCSIDSTTTTGANSDNVAGWLSEVAGGGGWHEQQQQPAQSHPDTSNVACEIIEISSLPSHEQFAQLLRTARPFIIRGGAAVGMGLDVKVSASFCVLSIIIIANGVADVSSGSLKPCRRTSCCPGFG